jgi:hypothetical protein
MPLPVWKRQSTAPVRASNASKCPDGSPTNTRPPAVASTLDATGSGARWLHTSRPVAGSYAFTCPHDSSSRFWKVEPMNGIPSRYSAGLFTNFAHVSITGT